MWNISSLRVLIKSSINFRLSVKKLVILFHGAISARGKDLLVELLSCTRCCTPPCWGLLCSHFFTMKSSSFVPKRKFLFWGIKP
jgi:hypothetical protein